MTDTFENMLEKYAELIVKFGVNLQTGQRLLIGPPAVWMLGTPIETAPFVRKVAEHAYRAGARRVDVIWNDPQMQRLRIEHAQTNTLTDFPKWQVEASMAHINNGDAVLFILAEDPDLYRGLDPKAVSTLQTTTMKQTHEVLDAFAKSKVQTCVVAAPVNGWADKVFPDFPTETRDQELWKAIFSMCRADQADPIADWKTHMEQMKRRSDYLNEKRYDELYYSAPGTELRVGLPTDHLWRHIQMTDRKGTSYVLNIPSEEIWCMPHKDCVDGTVVASKPLSFGGTVIEGIRFVFKEGCVVESSATQGQEVLKSLLESDEGSRRLGEVALVSHSSPISRMRRIFYNILIDENAASHLALGLAYKFNMKGGIDMSDEEFHRLGGNQSSVHVDFMIGSEKMDVFGVTKSGKRELIMNHGEWVI